MSDSYDLMFDPDKKEVYFLSPKGKEVSAMPFYYEGFKEVSYFPECNVTKAVAKACEKLQHSGLPILDEDTHEELLVLFNVEDCTKQLYSITTHYLAKMAVGKITVAGYGLSYEGFDLLFHRLLDTGSFDIESIVENIPDILTSYQECEPEHILSLADIDKDTIPADEVMTKALDYLGDNGIFYDTFELNDKDMILASVF